MAATVIIDIPSVIHVEAVPDFLFEDLPIQPTKVTLAMPQSGFRMEQPPEYWTRCDEFRMACIIHVHYG
jgi:hypothetical protein